MRSERNSQEQLWTKVLFLHQWIHTTISLSYFVETETTARWEKFMINDGMLPTSMKTPDQLDVKVDDVDFYLPPIHQKNVNKLIMPYLNNYYKTPCYLPKVGDTVLRALAHCGCLCCQSNMAIFFCFIQNSQI